MRFGLLLRLARRESRGSRGRAAFVVACLALGVAAVVGVAGLVGAVETGIRSQSRALLAADLAVEGRRPLPPELDDFFADLPGTERTDVREMATMVSRPTRLGAANSRLCELKVIRGTYPFYGVLELEPPATMAELLDEDSVVVAPEVLTALGLRAGESLSLGGVEFRIAGVVRDEPDRLDFSLTLGPRVFISEAGLERTALVEFGSRVKYRALFRLPAAASGDLAALEARLETELPGAEFLSVETHEDSQPTVRRALRRTEHFLGLVALLSLILGGTGVAQIVRVWLAGRATNVAILRCLGLRPREILVLYLGHVAGLALLASTLGAAAGAALPLVVTKLAPDLVPADLLRLWQPLAWLRGIGLGLGVALVFSLPPLTAIWRVSPARVLRNDAEPLPEPWLVKWTTRVLLLGGVFGAAWVQSERLDVAAVFAVGLLVLVALLAAAAKVVMSLSSRLPRERLNPYLVHGLAALARPGAGTTGAVVALGLGVMVVLAMTLVERRLASQLRTALPEDAPSSFLVDIQPDQWEDVRGLLDESEARNVDSVPVVMARLRAIDGRDVEELADERDERDGRRRARWVLTREQRLTWRDELPEGNQLTEGELWSDPAVTELSLEEDFAQDLGAGIGTELTFDVQGVPMTFTVTSLRSVEWQTFGINFFVMVEPGALEEAPHIRLAAARLTVDGEQRLQDGLATRAPNVLLIGVRAILQKVTELLGRLAFAVRVLGGFTVLTGIAILAGAVSSTTLRRRRETALLKTLGITRGGVAALLATEYALVGLVAGALGAAGALGLAWAFFEFLVELQPDLPWSSGPLTAVASAALAVVCGLAASARALAVKPIESLRG